jgi:peptidyl-tRNA hydrolase, PTH1 family
MNLSGEPTRKALGDAGLPNEDWKEKLIVVHDELDLPVGRMKIQADRGAGGHNGIKSIIGSLGTQAFARVRVGVDKPPKGQGADWVLGRFKKGEAAAVADAIERAADAVEMMIKKGVDAASNEFNRESKQQP